MKHNYVILAIISLLAITANAQWITLYEGGNNTTHNLQDEWAGYFNYIPDGSGEDGEIYTGLGSVANNFQILYYFQPFGDGAAGIFKEIPTMEKYASLRVKLNMNLSDTVGTINYYSVNSSETGISGTIDNWNNFGSDVLDEYVYLSNIEGDSSIYFRTDLLRGDSVFLSYNYVLIEADTTQMLNINVNSPSEYTVFSHGSQINITSTNDQETFKYSVVSMSGNEMIKGEATGNSSINDDLDSGFYFVLIKSNTSTIRRKVYLN